MPRFRKRDRWRNQRGGQWADPLRIYTPAGLADVVDIVQEAEANGVTVRALGSGHSWSDVARPEGYALRPDGMRSALALEFELLRWPANRLETLVRVGAGMRIRELNRLLEASDRALINMGGYDGQTVAGAISTSTHGSGRDLGPLCDAVRSIDLVAAGGIVHRVEPAAGPTDPARWRARYPAPEHRLVQDDRFFAAVVVGLGCLGVICSVYLEVRDAYLLKERRTGTTWEHERERIDDGLARHRHYELLLTPYPRADGRHPCMVTTRHPVPGPRPPWWSSASRRNLFAETVSSLPGAGLAMKAIAALAPSLVPATLAWTLDRLADDEFTGPSQRVLNIGAANALPAQSMEIGVPVDDNGSHIGAVDAIFRVAAEFRTRGRVFHTGPIALRFVAGSPAILSMMHGRELTMMIELILVNGSYGSRELFAAYDHAVRPFGGRPHWGQVNALTRADVEALYPRFGEWLEVHAELAASGVFGGPFARRIGLHPT